jgi:hypothetical protein
MTDTQADAGLGGNPEKITRNKKLHIREKIRAAVILERLERNALGELTPPMTKDQIKSAEVVLKKTIPDLQTITLQGDDDGGAVNLNANLTVNYVRPAD